MAQADTSTIAHCGCSQVVLNGLPEIIGRMDVSKRRKEICEQRVNLLGIVRCNRKQVFEVSITWVQGTGKQPAKRGCVGLDFDIGRLIRTNRNWVIYVQNSMMVGRREFECARPRRFGEAVLEQSGQLMQEFGQVDDVEHENTRFLERVTVTGEETLHKRILRRGPNMTVGAIVREMVFFEVVKKRLRNSGSPPIWNGPNFGANTDPFAKEACPSENVTIGFCHLKSVGLLSEILGTEFSPRF